jgi:hypothetical protein
LNERKLRVTLVVMPTVEIDSEAALVSKFDRPTGCSCTGIREDTASRLQVQLIAGLLPTAGHSVADLLPDDLDQHALGASTVELAVEDLLPGAEVEFPLGDRHNDLSAHHLPLHVSISVVLAGAVVPVSLR